MSCGSKLRARLEVERADLAILLLGADQPNFSFADLQSSLPESLRRICVINKSDLLTPELLQPSDTAEILSISTQTGSGLAELCNKILALTAPEFANEGSAGAFSARLRHVQALELVQAHLAKAQSWLLAEHGELAAEEMRLAQISLSEITGVFSADDLLGKIFSSFCIGK